MRFAIEIKGQVEIFNNDELSGLIDNNVEFKVIGRVCDDKEYGDRCSTDCPALAYSTRCVNNSKDMGSSAFRR